LKNETSTFFCSRDRNTNEIKKAIIEANNAIASVRAKGKDVVDKGDLFYSLAAVI
jgi:hypothetical protein